MTSIITHDWISTYNTLDEKEGKTRIYKLINLVSDPIALLWEKLFPVLASIEPIKIRNKYSPQETIKNAPKFITTPYGTMPKEQFSALINILYNIPRSVLLPGPAANHPQWSQLVPLWLAAYKEYKNIGYNEWIRDDSIKFMVGSMYKEFSKIPENYKFDKSRLQEYRTKALTFGKDRRASITSPVKKGFYLEEGFRIPINSAVGAMYLQIWLANVSLRHPNMILDPFDWERVPEPYDVQMLEVNEKSRPRSKLRDELEM